MPKVYVVTAGEYSSAYTAGIFSSRENAEAFVKETHNDNDIDEFELDEYVGAKMLPPVAAIDLRLDTGEARLPASTLDYMWRRGALLFPPTKAIVRDWSDQTPPFILCVSAVSLEHAVKMAAEYRQAWLRTEGMFVVPEAPLPETTGTMR